MDDILQYAFLRNALLSACSVALCASLIGYFLIGRGMTFVAHALPNIGFAGAMGAVLLGFPPLWGLLAFSSGSALAFSFLGRESRKKDQGIGVVMMLALGLGSLFLGLYRGSSQKAYGILFGSILGVGESEAWATLVISVIVAVALLLFYRPLLFSTIDEQSAAAKGVPVRALGAVFLLLAAVTVALAVPVTGTLLVFTLLIGPPATARRLTRRAGTALLLGVALAELDVTVGLFLAAWQGTIPVGFFVTTLSFVTYIVVRVIQGRFSWKR